MAKLTLKAQLATLQAQYDALMAECVTMAQELEVLRAAPARTQRAARPVYAAPQWQLDRAAAMAAARAQAVAGHAVTRVEF